MRPYDLKKAEEWFTAYTDTFVSDATDPSPYILKQEHTTGVCSNIDMLTASLGLPASERLIARTAALFHDIGRFRQFKTWGTFSDLLSQNHAALGASIVVKERQLVSIPVNERRLILRAIVLHNRADLPRTISRDLKRLTSLLRDADKLDIYRVMTTLYKAPSTEGSGYITHDLPDNGQIPEDLADLLISGCRIPYHRAKTLNGMKLFQLSMIYDLNFPASFRWLREKEIVESYIDSLPPHPLKEVFYKTLSRYIDNTLKITIREPRCRK